MEKYQTYNIPIDSEMKMETADVSNKATTTSDRTIASEKYKDECNHLHEMTDLLSRGIITLKEDLTRLNIDLSKQSQSIETLDKTLSTLKLSTDESTSAIDAMNTNLTILRQELFSLNQKYEDHQVTSYDGTLIWKIDHFQEKMSKNIYFFQLFNRFTCQI